MRRVCLYNLNSLSLILHSRLRNNEEDGDFEKFEMEMPLDDKHFDSDLHEIIPGTTIVSYKYQAEDNKGLPVNPTISIHIWQ